MTHAFPHKFSVAPMLDWTDRHCRYFLRLISKHTLLYTEMITTGAILHGDQHYHLAFDASEHPLALQLGGSDPHALAQCAKIAQTYGYDEINLNIGCPSDRVQNGKFGACLMAEPNLVADCVKSMRDVLTSAIPVTVKTRIGIDDQDSYDALQNFISIVANAGCETFIIHARKAWLHGLSPKENREIPPLRYDIAERLVQDFPDLNIVLNGGIKNIDDAQQQLKIFAGVMLGRAIYHDPFLLADVDHHCYQKPLNTSSRHAIIESYIPYIETMLTQGVPFTAMARHILNIFHGEPGARTWRRHLSENMHKPGAGCEIIKNALKLQHSLSLAH